MALAVLLFWHVISMAWFILITFRLIKGFRLARFMYSLPGYSSYKKIHILKEAESISHSGKSFLLNKLAVAKSAMVTAEDNWLSLSDNENADKYVRMAESIMVKARNRYQIVWLEVYRSKKSKLKRKITEIKSKPFLVKLLKFLAIKFPKLAARLISTKLGFKELKAGVTAAAKEYSKRNL